MALNTSQREWPTSEIAPMSRLSQITTSPALTFDALTAGEPGAPLVPCCTALRNPCISGAQVAALAGTAYRAVTCGD
jgi:hypothetical protein